jgi:hypothetical protein
MVLQLATWVLGVLRRQRTQRVSAKGLGPREQLL